MIRKWEALGRAQGEALGVTRAKIEAAKNSIAMGLSLEQTAKITGLDIETLKSL